MCKTPGRERDTLLGKGRGRRQSDRYVNVIGSFRCKVDLGGRRFPYDKNRSLEGFLCRRLGDGHSSPLSTPSIFEKSGS